MHTAEHLSSLAVANKKKGSLVFGFYILGLYETSSYNKADSMEQELLPLDIKGSISILLVNLGTRGLWLC